MGNIFNPQNIIGIITLLVYCIIYFIQKAQFTKQNEILNKYEKIFSIINVDEIEKYVELQKKSISLSYSNREIELKNNEKHIELKFSELEAIFNNSSTNLEESNEIITKLQSLLKQNRAFINQINKLNIEEFKELYTIIEAMKTKSPKIFKEIYEKIYENTKKYDNLKREVLEKITCS
ncbi:hypothetical protein FIA58_016955 [Flavobacterium jejuense]|uniref:Uncharacterized protein n=1 Tax=Flavobacterium jejuense TaxID=1544455 RepID=A0ABX0IZF0_9FLAO|nr:hypothetical protein [Flavobacterium jejuense]NHN27371.1 hypothetical protein [Flavobacterium jejuense]